MPQVSVIVPFFNEALHLEQCLSSILRQSFQDYEVLLIDDFSTDASFAIAQRIVANDARFHLCRNDQKGLFNARNKALMLAKGDYICFVDADDEACSDYLLELVSCAKVSSPDLVVQGYLHVISGQSHMRLPAFDGFHTIQDDPNAVFSSFDVNLLGNLFGKLYKLSIIQLHNIQFSSKVLMSEDLFFVLSYLFHCQTIDLSRRANYNYIIRRKSMSNSYWPFQTELGSFHDLDHAWKQVLDSFPCQALNVSYGVFIGNYTNRLIYSHLAHPSSIGFRHVQQEYLEQNCYPAFCQYFHPKSLFLKLLRWSALHGLYRSYQLLMTLAIKRYHLVVNFAS